MSTGALPVGSVSAAMSQMPPGGHFTEEVKKSAHELGKKLVGAWRTGASLPEAERGRSEFRERMLALVRYRAEEWPYEFRYWKEKTGA